MINTKILKLIQFDFNLKKQARVYLFRVFNIFVYKNSLIAYFMNDEMKEETLKPCPLKQCEEYLTLYE